MQSGPGQLGLTRNNSQVGGALRQSFSHSHAKTVGERSRANGARKDWIDLEDSSQEEDLEGRRLDGRTPSDLGLVRIDSYDGLRVPSFDDPNGTTIQRLQASTRLENIPLDAEVVAEDMGEGAADNAPSAAAEVDGNAAAHTESSTRHRFARLNKRRLTGNTGASFQRRTRPNRAPIANQTAAVEPKAGAQNENDEIWAERKQKRLNKIEEMKGQSMKAEYESMSKLRAEGQLGVAAPTTPDAHDRSLSKRDWEQKMMDWRQALKKLTQTSGISESVAAPKTSDVTA